MNLSWDSRWLVMQLSTFDFKIWHKIYLLLSFLYAQESLYDK